MAVLVGLLALAMVSTHGALYIALKTDGPLADRATRWARAAAIAYAAFFVAAVAAAPLARDSIARNFIRLPVLWLPTCAALGAIVLAAVLARRRPKPAFLASAASILLVAATWGAAMFPALVPARSSPELSLTAANASSSPLTLKIMLVAALAALPIVLAYSAWVYRTFRGKVQMGEESY
jgi:cytochrome d ubiquinol oxidase subunit II